ncbi:phage recombination protein Bet [bacterium]|nr:MAG: phage recombination protein Bet [bacterium]
MATDLTKPPIPIPDAPDWEGKTELIRRTVAAGATSDELELFLHMAKRAGLDPLARQIHFVKRRGRGVVQVGIDGLRLTADRTGLYAGNEDGEFIGTTDGGYPAKSKVTVYKLVGNQRCPFTATARWDEYYPGDEQGFMWRKMPHTMLAKCAEALALRKAFPADLSGLYIHEEMEQAGATANPIETSEVVEAPALEGRDLLDATARSFGDLLKSPVPIPEGRPEPKLVSPDGKEAFGYAPVRWPLPRMFNEPMSDNQRKMMGAKARERGIDEEAIADLRREVLHGYGLDDDATKAAASLFIDWLLNVNEEGLDEGLAAAQG